MSRKWSCPKATAIDVALVVFVLLLLSLFRNYNIWKKVTWDEKGRISVCKISKGEFLL